eukprot:3688240-Prymnesium_polylepis.2
MGSVRNTNEGHYCQCRSVWRRWVITRHQAREPRRCPGPHCQPAHRRLFRLHVNVTTLWHASGAPSSLEVEVEPGGHKCAPRAPSKGSRQGGVFRTGAGLHVRFRRMWVGHRWLAPRYSQ